MRPYLPDLGDAEQASQLVERFYSESALCDSRQLRRILHGAAIATKDEIDIAAQRVAMFSGCRAQYQQYTSLREGVSELRASHDKFRQQAGIVSCHVSAHHSAVSGMEADVREREAQVTMFQEVEANIESSLSELAARLEEFTANAGRRPEPSASADVDITAEMALLKDKMKQSEVLLCAMGKALAAMETSNVQQRAQALLMEQAAAQKGLDQQAQHHQDMLSLCESLCIAR